MEGPPLLQTTLMQGHVVYLDGDTGALSYIKPNLHISRDSSIPTAILRALNIWMVLCLTNVLQSNPISIDPGPCLSPWRYWEPSTVVNEGCIQIWIQSKIYVRISSQPPHNWKSFNVFKLNGLAWKAFHIFVLCCSMLHTHPFPRIPIDCDQFFCILYFLCSCLFSHLFGSEPLRCSLSPPFHWLCSKQALCIIIIVNLSHNTQLNEPPPIDCVHQALCRSTCVC